MIAEPAKSVQSYVDLARAYYPESDKEAGTPKVTVPPQRPYGIIFTTAPNRSILLEYHQLHWARIRGRSTLLLIYSTHNVTVTGRNLDALFRQIHNHELAELEATPELVRDLNRPSTDEELTAERERVVVATIIVLNRPDPTGAETALDGD